MRMWWWGPLRLPSCLLVFWGTLACRGRGWMRMRMRMRGPLRLPSCLLVFWERWEDTVTGTRAAVKAPASASASASASSPCPYGYDPVPQLLAWVVKVHQGTTSLDLYIALYGYAVGSASAQPFSPMRSASPSRSSLIRWASTDQAATG
jgi:hypothetical protein